MAGIRIYMCMYLFENLLNEKSGIIKDKIRQLIFLLFSTFADVQSGKLQRSAIFEYFAEEP